MAINYTEQGHRLHRLIRESGYTLVQRDGVWLSSDDVAVQAIIDGYDALSEAQADAKARVGIEASKRVAEVYPFTSIAPAARLALPNRLQTVADIRDTAIAKNAEIDALTTWEECDDYNETTGWE